MSEYWIYHNNRDYLAKNLTSHSRITLNFKRYAFKGKWYAWQKEFSFGGDKLLIESEFYVPYKKDFFNYNPIYKKLEKGYKIKEYKEIYGKDKNWNDYMKFVAKDTNSETEFNSVCEQSKIVIDLLNQCFNEGKSEIEKNCSQYDYRYILLDKERMYVAHRGFFFENDKEAIDAIKDIEDGTGYICLEIEKSLNEAECKEGNFYYKSIWTKQ